ncbi:MAG TPA: cupredoxin domain-containing protein [Dehalococcoidia bacterium]|nr:cupredoxin domain-containing protein [Dehalococcoidia bacterium]
MALITQSHPSASKRGIPTPSWKVLLALAVLVGAVWAALAVQAAILSDWSAGDTTSLQKQINDLKSGQAATSSFPMEVSDQAKAQPFDASLPPATDTPVKEISLTATDNTMIGIAKGINFQGWSFGDSIPAKPLHVRQGDTVKFTLTNTGSMGHGMDFHAAEIDPGANYKTVLPGASFSFTWTANRPGVFMFHCSAAPVIQHIADGMFGAIVVDPPTPLPPAKEYVLVQSEYYLKQQGQSDVYAGDVNKMLANKPDYVVFNGMVNQYREHPLTADPGQLVRLYVVNAGPSATSAFHVIGTIFSAVYPDGNTANKLTGVQTYNIPPGGGAMFEMTMPNPGAYPFVTHAFADASKGAIGVIQVGQPPAAVAGSSTAAQPMNMATMPAAQRGAQPAQAAGKAQTGAQAQTGQAAAGGLALTTTDNAFSQKQITVQAGQAVTINLTNKGSAVHNLHVIGLKGADGKDVQTALLEGGKSGSVTFTPTQPGTYKFQCDVHPAEMTGTLTVK